MTTKTAGGRIASALAAGPSLAFAASPALAEEAAGKSEQREVEGLDLTQHGEALQ